MIAVPESRARRFQLVDITKVTVNLPTDTLNALKNIAAKRGTTVTEALRQVIESQNFLQSEMENGSKVLIQNPDRSMQQLVFNAPLTNKKGA
jgi:metal-responsive CopG/Arc/MetJ family transcriptional regulator